MDIGEILAMTFGILVLGFVVFLIGYGFIVLTYLDPIRDNKAQLACVDSGFETFITYKSKIFTTDILALYCGNYEQRMIKEGRIDAYQNTGDEKGTFVIKSSSGG